MNFVNLCVFSLFLFSTPGFAQTLAPEVFEHEVTLGEEVITVNFEKFSNRSPLLFDVILETAEDTDFIDHTHDEVVRTYIGSVENQPGTIAAGMIRANGEILARITFGDGTEWLDTNGTVTTRGTAITSSPSTSLVPPGGAGDILYAADVMMDLPYRQMVGSGGTAATALEMAEFCMMCINTSFIRDAAVLNRVGLVIIRMDPVKDPYASDTSTNQMLGRVRDLHGSIVNDANSLRGNHDLGLTASPQVGGGLAYVGVVASNSGFSSNGSSSSGDFSVVARHELGHNWGSSHFEGGGTPEGNTIMSGNSLGRFSSGELTKIIAHRDNRVASLENLGNTAPAVPPRAAADVIALELGSLPITISPLDNDSDTNGGPISITEFDSPSRHGHIVTQIGDDIRVPVSVDYTQKVDRISYEIQDATQKTSRADIFVRTYMDGDTLGHWTFENGTTRALDSSSFVNHASLGSDALIEDGVLHLDGSDDQASVILNKSVDSNTITYSAMIYRNGDQNSFAGIVFQNAGGVSTGLNIGVANELRYHWNNSSNWSYDSGLIIPDQRWVFVALVIDPDKATFYMDDGVNGMQTAIRSIAHPVKPHVSYSVGRNPGSGSRVVNGMLDDACIINRSLDAAEIADLAANGLGARDPYPQNGSMISKAAVRVQWTKSALASAERFYISNNYALLRDALIGGAEDKGFITENRYDLTTTNGRHYYWRVDSTETNGEVVKGSIWTFEIVDEALVVDLSLDTAADFSDGGSPMTRDTSGNEIHGTLVNAPPHTSGNCGECCGFNLDTDSNQAISLGMPEELNFGETKDFTAAMWVRPSSTSRGQVFLSNKDWDSGRNAGYTIGTNSNLRIEWNIGDGTNRQDYDGPAEQLPINVWSHLAVSHDRDSVAKLFLNGALVSTEAITSIGDINSGLPTQLGTDGEGDYDFKGALDEVKIFARALSEEDIATLYRQSTRYYKWASDYFSGLDLEDSSLSGPGADPAGDGIPNLLSFAFQTNPQSPNRSLFPEFTDRGFSFVRMKGGEDTGTYRVAGLEYTVEMSSALGDTSWFSDSIEWEESAPRENETNDTERLYIRPVDQDAERIFFRLRLHTQ